MYDQQPASHAHTHLNSNWNFGKGEVGQLTNEFAAQEVVAWGNAGREVEVPPAVALDHAINAPDAVVEALGSDFGPLET